MSGFAPSRVKLVAAFAALYVLWGSNFLAIRYAAEAMPPFLMMAVRCLIAGAILFAWAWLRDGARPAPGHWRSAARGGNAALPGLPRAPGLGGADHPVGRRGAGHGHDPGVADAARLGSRRAPSDDASRVGPRARARGPRVPGGTHARARDAGRAPRARPERVRLGGGLDPLAPHSTSLEPGARERNAAARAAESPCRSRDRSWANGPGSTCRSWRRAPSGASRTW